MSLWLKYESPNFRQSILSHENFEDQNTGGWNLYYFRDYLRLHTVHQSYHHDQTDIPRLKLNEWFHLSVNVKSSGYGNITVSIYINGKLLTSHKRKMLFLNHQVPLVIGGLTQNAMSAFSPKDKKHNFFFKGEMAELVYMNRLLSESTIKELFEGSKSKFID
jgi:hypothetical protein